MHNVIQLIEDHDLFTPELAKNFVLRRPLLDIRNFRDKLNNAIAQQATDDDHPRDPLSFYSFMASACLRGDNCSRWQCRLSKAQMLARYAVLYCDQVLFPLWLNPAEADPPEDNERRLLGGALLTIIELRELIEKSLIKLVPHDLQFCTKHMEEEVPGYGKMLFEAKRRVSRIASEFKFTYDNYVSNGHLTIEGPEDYIEHGERGFIFHTQTEWAKTFPLKRHDQKILSTSFAVKHELLGYIFEEAVSDAALQQYYSSRFNNKYLTNLPGEAYLLSQLNKTDSEPPQAAAVADLSHKLPLLRDLPISTLLKIRAEEYDSFLLYRNALEKAARERFKQKTHVTDQEAKELYNDLLLPQLLQLRANIRASTRMNKKKSFLKSSVTTAVVVGLGAFSGILPAKLIEWAGTIQGVNLVREIGESKLGASEIDPSYKSHDLYFLLRASEYLADEII